MKNLMIIAAVLLGSIVANAQNTFSTQSARGFYISPSIGEDNKSDSGQAIMLIGKRMKLTRGTTIGYAFEGDSTAYTGTLDGDIKMSRRVPMILNISDEEFIRMIDEPVEWLVIGNEWYELTAKQQENIRIMAKYDFRKYTN